MPVPEKKSTNINSTQSIQGLLDVEKVNLSLTCSQTIRVEHCQPQDNIVPQTEHILDQMHGPIRENTDKQALQQPPEGVDAEQQLYQDRRQLWDYTPTLTVSL